MGKKTDALDRTGQILTALGLVIAGIVKLIKTVPSKQS